jgi:hypothetical protein
VPKPFDATTKHLLETDPGAWMTFADLVPDGPVTVLDTDLSTVTSAADGVYRVDGPEPWLVHFEFQSSADRLLNARLLRYNVLLSDRYDLPVQSVVILLRPEADSPSLTGVHQRRLPDGRLCHEFHYRVVRLWERPVDEILEADLALLPLAPLTAVSPTMLPDVLHRVDERMRHSATPEEAKTLWTGWCPDLILGSVWDGFRVACPRLRGHARKSLARRNMPTKTWACHPPIKRRNNQKNSIKLGHYSGRPSSS